MFANPLYRYSNGRFSLLKEKPAFLLEAEKIAEEGTWFDAIEKAGFPRVSPFALSEDPVIAIEVFARIENENAVLFYAEAWDPAHCMWAAIFEPDEWPDFTMKIIAPAISAASAFNAQEKLADMKAPAALKRVG